MASDKQQKDTAGEEGERPVTFEESVRRLQTIVEQLEGGQLPLEQSLELFEQGVELARAAQGVLARAERRVELLLSVDDGGAPVVRELETAP